MSDEHGQHPRSETDGLRQTLTEITESLTDVGVPGAIIRGLEKLLIAVEQPCTVAVVGRVKAGKSTFVNALLGEDLAKVGATETTATINRFVYGVPDPAKPVRCYWTGGKITDEDKSFLDSLQGNDEASLRRAAGIESLEYRVPAPFLKRVTLVDTPGLAAAVDEHQDRAASFFGVQGQLRDRNVAATERLSNEADAVIYVIGQVARTTDQAFLEEFQRTTQGKARVQNAIGVLSKVDIQPEVLARRHSLCQKISEQLKDVLNVVVPVSAALQRRLDELCANDAAEFRTFAATVSAIPDELRELLLQSDELFTQLEMEDCPIPAVTRQALLGNTPWTTFVTLAREAGLAKDAESTTKAITTLQETAGFSPLRDLLHRRFVERGELLRGYRILNEAKGYLSDLRYRILPDWKKTDRPLQQRFNRFIEYVKGFDEDEEDAEEQAELLAYLESERQTTAGRSAKLESTLKDADRRLTVLLDELQEVYDDYESLELLDKAIALQVFVIPEEIEELRSLFGLYGRETALRLQSPRGEDIASLRKRAEDRARAWKNQLFQTRTPEREALCRRTADRYETLLGVLWDS